LDAPPEPLSLLFISSKSSPNFFSVRAGTTTAASVTAASTSNLSIAISRNTSKNLALIALAVDLVRLDRIEGAIR
jgi:hypothetical protein